MCKVVIGDVILVNFVFDDSPGDFKIRPAVIIEITHNGIDALGLKVTSAPPRDQRDYILKDWAVAGLTKPSTVRTLKQMIVKPEFVIKVLGKLSQSDLANILQMRNQEG